MPRCSSHTHWTPLMSSLDTVLFRWNGDHVNLSHSSHCICRQEHIHTHTDWAWSPCFGFHIQTWRCFCPPSRFLYLAVSLTCVKHCWEDELIWIHTWWARALNPRLCFCSAWSHKLLTISCSWDVYQKKQQCVIVAEVEQTIHSKSAACLLEYWKLSSIYEWILCLIANSFNFLVHLISFSTMIHRSH